MLGEEGFNGGELSLDRRGTGVSHRLKWLLGETLKEASVIAAAATSDSLRKTAHCWL